MPRRAKLLRIVRYFTTFYQLLYPTCSPVLLVDTGTLNEPSKPISLRFGSPL